MMTEEAIKARRAYKRRWRLMHREEINAYHKAWREAHKDQYNAYQRKYRAEHKEQIKAYEENRWNRVAERLESSTEPFESSGDKL